MTQISDEMVERALDGFHGLDRSALPPTDHGFRWADSMHTSMRCALSAALADAADHVPDTGEMVGTRWRHKGRGTTYTEVGRAEVQASGAYLGEGAKVVIYRGEDSKLWARSVREFEDGRFERLPGAPAAPTGDTVAVRLVVAFADDGSVWAQPISQFKEGLIGSEATTNEAWQFLADDGYPIRSCIATIHAPRPAVAEVSGEVEGA